MQKWQLMKSVLSVDSPWLRVRKNSYKTGEGVEIPEYYIAERSDSTLCVCKINNKFLLTKQYRAGIDDFTYCHPGGRLESNDSSPVSGALRELLEETGITAKSVHKLGSFAQIPAVSSAKVHLFLVIYNAPFLVRQKLDKSEQIDLTLTTESQLKELIETNKMNCIACVAATYRALDFLSNFD